MDAAGGRKVPLSLVADVREGRGPNIINREGVQRRIGLAANVSGRDLGSTGAEIQRRVSADVHLPEGYFIAYEGQFQSQQEANRLILLLSGFTLSGMFLVLYAHFRSVEIVFQILLNIPLAFIGGLFATWLLVGEVSIATPVGLITLSGIAMRNTIMMTSLTQQRRRQFKPAANVG